MASLLASRAQALQASKAVFSGRTQRPVPACRRSLVCRAEDTGVAKTDRPKDKLYVGASEASLTYLDGTLPGDYGFDPLGLMDPTNSGGLLEPSWLRYGEIMNGRWAMLGAAGCIAPEILASAGFTPASTAGPWFTTGVIPPAGIYEGYWTDPWSLFFVEVVLLQFAELKRLQDYRFPGSQGKQYFLGLEKVLGGSGDPAYPGGPFFNLFNFGKTEAEMNKYKANELENGRLAMIAIFGYGAQALITKQGPWQNLLDHLADPTGNNILTNFGKVYGSL